MDIEDNASDNNIDAIEKDLFTMVKNMPHYLAANVYQNIHRKLALLKLEKNEIQSIYHLTESHSPGLRYRAEVRYEKSLLVNKLKPLSLNLNSVKYQCADRKVETNDMLKIINEMPKEWTIIQITPMFELSDALSMDIEEALTPALHLSIFNCGTKIDPLCVVAHKPKDKMGNHIEIRKEFNKLIKENHDSLQGFKNRKSFKSYAEKQAYCEQRLSLNNKMKEIVKLMEESWLKEWRCLLIGKFTDGIIDEKIKSKINDMLQENNMTEITEKSKHLLYYLVKGTSYIPLKDIISCLQYIFPKLEEQKDLQIKISKSVRAISECLLLTKAKRHPVILIIDNKLDHLPWEMMNVLQDHPVSRMPSLHFTYALFKEYEHSIVDGIKTGVNSENGKFILNPGLDLKVMETRLHNFFTYWKPNWEGIIGVTPSETDFERMLTSGDIFSYSGHGSGTQFLSGNKIERMRIEAVVLLFGCGSVKLSSQGPQIEMDGSYQKYLIACSPCVLGMLWAVTDTDTDILTTEFFSLWLPTKAPYLWKMIDRVKWGQSGEIVPLAKKTLDSFNVETNKYEPEILRALSKARKAPNYYLTQAACVARGLPVKIGQ